MSISVSRSAQGKTGLVQLPIDDILYFEFDRGIEMIAVHTLTEKFFIPGTLKYWLEVLTASGYNFEMVDRNNAVNLCRIKHVDKTFKLAYFEEAICKESKRCTVSISNINTVLKAQCSNKAGFATS